MTDERQTIVRYGNIPAKVFNQHWRVGTQLTRTIYSTTEDEDIFIGIVEDGTIANHIVGLHNTWIDRLRNESR